MITITTTLKQPIKVDGKKKSNPGKKIGNSFPNPRQDEVHSSSRQPFNFPPCEFCHNPLRSEVEQKRKLCDYCKFERGRYTLD